MTADLDKKIFEETEEEAGGMEKFFFKS